jgi:hypothetical protein
MLRLNVLLIIFSLSVVSCSGIRPYSATEAATDILIVSDWAQTLQISEHPERWEEHNPLLGSHPSKERVNWSIGGALLANTVIHRVLPTKWLGKYQLCLIVAESTAVIGNYQLGIRTKF